MPTASFIVPCYNEEASVRAFVDAFENAFRESAIDWRLVMIDDGSIDATLEQLEAIAQANKRISVISFSRNFGKEAAIYAGLEHAKADFIGIIDADLQQSPTTAREMLEALMADEGIDCVAAYQDERNENPIVSFLKNNFYKVFARAARTIVLANASDFRVFKACIADAILSLPEYYRFSKGIFAWVGFKTLPWPYVPEERAQGESKWSVRQLFGYAFEGLLSFTTEPLHFITKLGAVISALGIIYALIIAVQALTLGIDVPGYASTISLIVLLGGGQFFAIGMLGEYLGRAYIQGKHRPIYILKKTINLPADK